jgi:hypothetical protein
VFSPVAPQFIYSYKYKVNNILLVGDSVKFPALSANEYSIYIYGCSNSYNGNGTINVPKMDCNSIAIPTFTSSFDAGTNTLTCIALATDTLLSDWWVAYDLISGAGGDGDEDFNDTFVVQNIPYGVYDFYIGHTVGGAGCWLGVADTIHIDNTDGSPCDAHFLQTFEPVTPYTMLTGISTPGLNHIWIYGTDTISNTNSCIILYVGTFSIQHIVYDNNGCNSSFTDTLGYPQYLDCYNDFYMPYANTSNPNEYTLYSWCSNLLEHTWTVNGDTISHGCIFNYAFTGPGTYDVCLTVTGDNCTETLCQTISPNNNTINGEVYYEDNNCDNCINNATAYLYKIEYTDTTTIGVYVTSAPVVNNNYSFNSLENGNYIVRAALDTIHPQFDNYLPTYSFDNEYWQDAYRYTLLGINNMSSGINLLSVALNPGSGLIGGGVVIEDTLRSSVQEGITVFVKNTSSGNITRYCLTKDDGTFKLTNLAFGTYILYADLPGYTCVPQTFVLTAANPAVSDVELHLYLSIPLGITQTEAITTIGNPYPNPAGNKISVSVNTLKKTDLLFTLYNIVGQQMCTKTITSGPGEQIVDIDIESLPQGIYILVATDKKHNTSYTKKIIKSQ